MLEERAESACLFVRSREAFQTSDAIPPRICVDTGRACGLLLTSPLAASQNFEYKMSNILDKPLEVRGPLAISAAPPNYLASSQLTSHFPLSQTRAYSVIFPSSLEPLVPTDTRPC